MGVEAVCLQEGKARGAADAQQSRQKMGHSAVHLGPVMFEVPTVPWYTRASP